jgi:cell division protein FtsB
MVFIAVIFGYLLLGTIKLIFENYRIHQEANKLQTDINRLGDSNKQLESLLAYYQTDSYKEKEARIRLNFQKPGERVIPVPVKEGDDTSSITQPGVETEPATPASNPKQWWEYFFSKRSA